MNRVLIAGSTGFIGRSLVDYFGDKGIEIFTISRKTTELQNYNSFTPKSFLDIEGNTFKKIKLDGFIYAIGDPQMQGKSEGEIELLTEILAKLESLDFKGKFVLISSNAANPDSGHGSINYRAKLSNAYIIRKQKLEKLVQASKLNVAILRAPAVVGPDMNTHSHVKRLIVNNLLRKIFRFKLFAGTLEIITVADLALEVENILQSTNNTKVIEPVAPCYTWTNLAEFLDGQGTLEIYRGGALSQKQEKLAQLLPIDLRLLLFPHWITKNPSAVSLVESRHNNIIEIINHLKSEVNVLEGWHVVTGSSSGLGAETARQLLLNGQNVIGVDISPDPQSEVRLGAYKGKFLFIRGDLSSNLFVSQLTSQLDQLEIAGIFSIAGIGPRMEATNTSPLSLKKTFDVNFFLPVSLYLYLRERASRRAYFVFVGSSAGIMGLPRFSAYSSSKSSLVTYFFSVICESPQDNVDIFGVIPSGMKTNFQKNNGVPSSPLDKVLLADPSRVASQMIKWVGKGKRKSKIQHVGISAAIFLVIRNFSFSLKTSIVKKLSEGSR